MAKNEADADDFIIESGGSLVQNDDYAVNSGEITFKRNFVFSVRDNCANYNPFAVDSRQLRDLEDDEAVGNIGILIVKKKAKDFFYRRYQGFNTLVITV